MCVVKNLYKKKGVNEILSTKLDMNVGVEMHRRHETPAQTCAACLVRL